MGKLTWDHAFTVTPKEIAVALSLVATFSVGMYRLGTLESAFREHVAEAKEDHELLIVDGDRLNSLEMRIDPCCPLFHGMFPQPVTVPGPASPKEVVPPWARK